MHYSQQDATRLQEFPDASFDLIVSHILFHEVSHCAAINSGAPARGADPCSKRMWQR